MMHLCLPIKFWHPDTVTGFITHENFPGITNAREAMKNLPEEDRAKIAQQVEVFRIEKRAFDNEV